MEHGDINLFNLLDFSDKYSEVKLLDHMVDLFLISGETSILFSILDVPIYNLTN